MRHFMLFLLAFIAASTLAVSVRAQVTLEHRYKAAGSFRLVEVDSNLWKYVFLNEDTIALYNLDHSLDHAILIPSAVTPTSLILIAKRLFDVDDSYEYMVGVTQGLRVLKEDGTVLFACDSCSLPMIISNMGDVWSTPPAFQSTSNGTKMLIENWKQDYAWEVYNLPGKLPAATMKAGITDPSSALIDKMLPASAYPNPASGRVRIAYNLPNGVSSGEIVLSAEDGREVHRYHVTNVFSDLLIEATDLPSGSYFYKLVTDRGESPAQRIVWMR